MSGFSVTSDFPEFATRIERVAREVPEAVETAFRRVGDDVGESVRDVGARAMPHRGGLSAAVAQAGIRTRLDRGGRTIELEIEIESDIALGYLNEGSLLHPVWGNRGVWVGQSVPAGAFSAGAKDAEPRFVDAVDREIGRLVRKIG